MRTDMATETLNTVRRTGERQLELPEALAKSAGVPRKVSAVVLRKAMAAKLSKGDGESVRVYQAVKSHLVSSGFEFTLAELKAAEK